MTFAITRSLAAGSKPDAFELAITVDLSRDRCASGKRAVKPLLAAAG